MSTVICRWLLGWMYLSERFWLSLVLEFCLCCSRSLNSYVVWSTEERRKTRQLQHQYQAKAKQRLRVHVKQREQCGRKTDTLKRAQTSQWSQNWEMNNNNKNQKKNARRLDREWYVFNMCNIKHGRDKSRSRTSEWSTANANARQRQRRQRWRRRKSRKNGLVKRTEQKESKMELLYGR